MLNNFLFKKDKVFTDRRIISFNDLVFIHIPKTGGTSLIKALGINDSSHIQAKEIIKIKQDKHTFKSKFSFTIVRHPIERFVSLYNYACMDISYYHNNIEPKKGKHGIHLDYDLLKNATINECVSYLEDGKLKHDLSWNHWNSQYNWIYDEKGRKCLLNRIYKLENLHELIEEMDEKFNLKLDLQYLNVSKNNKTFENLSSDSIYILEKFYKKDFEFFDYKKY